MIWVPLKGDIGKDISELMHSYEQKGRIGNSKPKTRAKALKQAIAAAHSAAKNKKSPGDNP